MARPYVPGLSSRFIPVRISDVSTAGQQYIAPGFNGRIKKATSCLGGAISGANAGLTLKISGTAVTGGTITIAQSGSAAGDVDSCTPTGANTFTSTDNIEVETDGASTGTAEVIVLLELDA